MACNKFEFTFTKQKVVSNLRLILDYFVLLPIAVMSFFVLFTSSSHHDLRFSLLRLINNQPIAILFQANDSTVSIGVIPEQIQKQVQVLAPPPPSLAVLPENKAISVAQNVTSASSLPPPTIATKTVTIKPRDNLIKIFKRSSLDPKIADAILFANKSLKELRALKVGQEINLAFDQNKVLQSVSYQPDFKTTITFSRANNFRAQVSQLVPVAKLEYAFAPIEGSIFIAAQKAGIPKKVFSQVANALNSKINLKKGVRKGDKLALIYKDYYVKDKKVGNEEVVAAQIMHKNKAYSVLSFTDPKGNTNFYTPDGYSLKSPFIRFPTQFVRISSPFSLGRYHPILGYVRPHTGVDLAGHFGTPIKATSDGVISLEGYRGGTGKTIEIKHNQFSTLYGHMEAFAKGLHAGQTIHQGQLIGYMGNTGLATGPHLHYEFHINGKAYNPLTVKFPQGEMIASKYRAAFMAQAKKIMAMFASGATTSATSSSSQQNKKTG